jgi:hypothetical protein
VESDQIDVLAPTMLRDLEEVDHALETRSSREVGSNIREPDGQDRVHLDLTLFHPVPVAHSYVRTQPDADAASDLATANAIAEALGEDHPKSVSLVADRGGA